MSMMMMAVIEDFTMPVAWELIPVAAV